jgi:spoIIIJ-associated protein
MSSTDLASQPEEAQSGAEDSAGGDQGSMSGDAAPDTPSESGTSRPKPSRATDLVQEGDVAADYLESLLDILDLDGDLDMDVEGERAVVAVVGKGLGSLVGDKGETLDALQELTRLAVQREMGVRSRLMLDIGGFRAKRRAELAALGAEVAARVAASGEPERLKAMTPFERKVVHDAVAQVSGVHSESEGEEPSRRVVVLPD